MTSVLCSNWHIYQTHSLSLLIKRLALNCTFLLSFLRRIFVFQLFLYRQRGVIIGLKSMKNYIARHKMCNYQRWKKRKKQHRHQVQTEKQHKKCILCNIQQFAPKQRFSTFQHVLSNTVLLALCSLAISLQHITFSPLLYHCNMGTVLLKQCFFRCAKQHGHYSTMLSAQLFQHFAFSRVSIAQCFYAYTANKLAQPRKK